MRLVRLMKDDGTDVLINPEHVSALWEEFSPRRVIVQMIGSLAFVVRSSGERPLGDIADELIGGQGECGGCAHWDSGEQQCRAASPTVVGVGGETRFPSVGYSDVCARWQDCFPDKQANE